MEKRKVKACIIGVVATFVGVISRILFDGILFKVSEGNFIQIFVVIILMFFVFAGSILMGKRMSTMLNVVGAILFGAGVGGATVNAIEFFCLFLKMDNLIANVCQYIAFVALYVYVLRVYIRK